MASKGFIDDTKKVFKNTFSNPAKYWKYIDAPEDVDNVYHFCMKLFEALTSTSKDQYLDDDHEAMYSTLMVLEFYKNTKNKPERWLEETEKMLEESKPRFFEHAKWIVRLFLKNFEESQFAINFISSTCHIPQKFSWEIQPGQQIQQALKEASDYEDIIQFKRRDKPYKKFINIAYPQHLRQSKINAFSYCCFLDYLSSSNLNIKKKIWTHIMDVLKGLVHGLRYSGKSYELLRIFLFFLNNLIVYYGCAYTDVLKEMIYFINIVRNGYGLVADMSQKLFQDLHGELKCFGTAFRRQIRRNFVNIDSKRSDSIGSRKYLLTNRRISISMPEHCSLTNLRKLMILNVLGSCSIINMKKYWAIVQTLDGDTTFDLYFKLMRIIQIANNLQTYESIQNLIRESVDQLFQLGWKPYRKIRREEEEQLKGLVWDQSVMKFFSFPKFQLALVRPEDLATQNHRYSIGQLFEEVRQYPYNDFFFSSYLQFIFMGNDEELSSILQTLCEFMHNLPPAEYQKLAVYLVPVQDGQCSLSQYLSYKDIWYKRHVYNVFKQKLLFPNVNIEDPEIRESFPGYLFNKSLHMYVRQAKRKVPFRIFQCQYSIEDGTGRREAEKRYFTSNVCLGISIDVAKAKVENKKDKKSGYVDGLEYYLDKVKKVTPISVDVDVRYREPGTDYLVSRREKDMAIEDLVVTNTPKAYFMGHKPNPLDQFAEVCILTQNVAKIYRTELELRQNFKRHSDTEIIEAFKDLVICLCAQSIVVQRSEGVREYMKLMIDGVQINNVDKFKITAATNAQNLPMTLPVRGFLPFEA